MLSFSGLACSLKEGKVVEDATSLLLVSIELVLPCSSSALRSALTEQSLSMMRMIATSVLSNKQLAKFFGGKFSTTEYSL